MNYREIEVAPARVARIEKALEKTSLLEAQVDQFSELPLQVWLCFRVVPLLFLG